METQPSEPNEPAAVKFEGPEGMNIRDRFAAIALLGMNAYSGYTDGRGSSEEIRAASAYRQADAMLVERAKSRG